MSTDRNLLVALLAFQNNFISRADLLAAFDHWTTDKSRSIAELLEAQKKITPAQRQLIEALAAEHLKQHGNDPQRSLAALSSVEAGRAALAEIHDAELQQSLVHVRPGPAVNPEATTSYAVGAETSAGQRFRILRPHAEGGLGKVSIARDDELHREVALKEIKAKYADEPAVRARFTLEAEITGGLEHPGIVPVYGLGTYADGRPFYAMRFIRGDSLKDAITAFFAKHSSHIADDSRGDIKLPAAAYHSLEFRQLLRRFVDVCNAIAYAHARGVLHRDLKPGNIMLGKYGETLVVDWGLAKATGTADSSVDTSQAPLTASTDSSSAETMMGSAIGTLAYMSPEQAAGRIDQFGPATDIYLLGATLYHILTGHPPHRNRTAAEIAERVFGHELKKHEPKRWRGESALRSASIPAPLLAICLRAMAKNRQDRYRSALELAAEVERALADEAVQALKDTAWDRWRRWSRHHRQWVLAGGFALFIIATIAVAAYVGEVQNAKGISKLAQENSELASKNGELARQAEVRANNLRNVLAQSYLANGVNDYEQGRIDKGVADLQRAWMLTRDGNVPQLGDCWNVLLNRATRGGAAPTPPLRRSMWGSSYFLAFFADGRFLVASDETGGMRTWDTRTGEPLEELSYLGKPVDVKFSLGGDRCVTRGHKPSTIPAIAPTYPSGVIPSIPTPEPVEPNELQIWNTKTRTPVGARLKHDGEVAAFAICADGSRVITGSRDKKVRLWNANTGSLIGVVQEHPSELYAVAISSDGKHCVSSCSQEFNYWLCEDELKKTKTVAFKEGYPELRPFEFAPTGKHLLIAKNDKAQFWDASTHEPVGAGVTYHTAIHYATVSPQGKQILLAGEDKVAQLWDAMTGQPLGPPMRHDEHITALAFSPQGDQVVIGDWSHISRIWNLPVPQHTWMSSLGYESKLAFDAEGKQAVDFDGWLQTWDVTAGVPFFEVIRENYSNGAMSSRGNIFAASLEDGKVEFRATRTGKLLAESLPVDPQRDRVQVMCFSPTGDQLLICVGDEMEILDPQTGKRHGKRMRTKGGILAACFASDQQVLVISGDQLSSWDIVKGTLEVLPPTTDDKSILAFSPSFNSILLGENFSGNDFQHWTSRGKVELQKLKERHTGPGPQFLVSPKGDRLLSFSNKTGVLWDTSTGRSIGNPMAHDEVLRDPQFSPLGDLLVTLDLKRVHFWDPATATALILPAEPAVVGKTHFPPPGNQILMIGHGGKANCLRLPATATPPDRDAWIELHTGRRIEEDGSETPIDFTATWELIREKHGPWLRQFAEQETRRKIDFHAASIRNAVRSNDRRVALFHLGWYKKLNRNDPELEEQVAQLKDDDQ